MVDQLQTRLAPGLRRRLLVVAAFAAIYVFWGATFLAIRVGVQTLPPLMLIAVRSIAAGSILYPIARQRGAGRPPLRAWGIATGLGALFFLGCHGILAIQEQSVPSGLTALLLATIPLWMVLVAWAAPGGHPPSRRAAIGIALGFVGIGVLVSGNAMRSGTLHATNVIALLGSALSWAVGSVISNRWPPTTSALLGAAMELIAGGALVLIGSVALGETAHLNAHAASPQAIAALLYLIVFGSVVGFGCYIWLLRVSDPALVATYGYVNPVVALLLGWLVLGEQVTARTIIATIIIASAVVLIISGEHEVKQPI
jgi:drug/metabolite transporter (DMT)-like permease